MEQQPPLKKAKLNTPKDLISSLPDDVIVTILSFLPTNTVISTSALSKRWTCVWKKVPKLHFDSDFNQRLTSENILNILTSHEAPVLKSLRFSGLFDPLDLRTWIGIAFERKVEKLVIMIRIAKGRGPVVFPEIESDNYTKLKILKVNNSVDLSSPIIFNSLSQLHLVSVTFQDGEAASNLLTRCPKLEELVLESFVFVNGETITIAVPSLERLKLSMTHGNGGGGGYMINSPSLKYLNIENMDGLGFCRIDNASQIVEAKITNVFNIIQENILESLVSAKRLSFLLSPLEITLPHGHIFCGLLTLEMFTFQTEWWNLLSHMLHSSPNLQNLKLIGLGKPTDIDMGQNWNQRENVPECLGNSLHTFVWIKYRWRQENERNLATYILNNALILKRATFSTKTITDPTESEDHDELEERRQTMLNELANEVGALNPCEVVFETDSEIDSDSELADDMDSDEELDAGHDEELDAGHDEELDAGHDAESDEELDAESDEELDAEADAGSDAEADAGSDAEADAGSDAEPDAGSDTESDG